MQKSVDLILHPIRLRILVALTQQEMSTQELLETTVGVPDRGMLIVGGLTTSFGSHDEGGLPILDKIPILKRLFSAETRDASRDTLFILVRPQIIILAEEEQRME